MISRLCFLVAVLLGCAPAAATAQGDAVAMVLSDAADGQSHAGTGFFISADGRLLTCYHVIAGASKIRVIAADSWSDKVVVQAIDPSRDLAVLRVTGLRGRTAFLPLEPAVQPAMLAKGPLDVWSYATDADGATSPRRLAQAPPAAFITSAVPRDPETQQPLFSRPDLDIIPLQAPLSRGLSGAPLVAGGAVVGVVSGHAHPAGTAMWAMPVASVGTLPPVDLPPQQIDAWPPLSLMSSAWRNPRRSAELGAGLRAALDRWGQFIEAGAALKEKADGELSLLGNQAIERYSRAADLAVFRLGSRYLLNDLTPDAEAEFLKVLGPYHARADYYDDQFEALNQGEVVATLTRELETHFAARPASAAATALRERTLGQVAREFGKANAFSVQLAADVSVFSAIADSYNSVDTLGELKRDIYKAADTFRQAQQETKATSEVSSRLRVARSILESLFEPQPGSGAAD